MWRVATRRYSTATPRAPRVAAQTASAVLPSPAHYWGVQGRETVRERQRRYNRTYYERNKDKMRERGRLYYDAQRPAEKPKRTYRRKSQAEADPTLQPSQKPPEPSAADIRRAAQDEPDSVPQQPAVPPRRRSPARGGKSRASALTAAYVVRLLRLHRPENLELYRSPGPGLPFVAVVSAESAAHMQMILDPLVTLARSAGLGTGDMSSPVMEVESAAAGVRHSAWVLVDLGGLTIHLYEEGSEELETVREQMREDLCAPRGASMSVLDQLVPSDAVDRFDIIVRRQ